MWFLISLLSLIYQVCVDEVVSLISLTDLIAVSNLLSLAVSTSFERWSLVAPRIFRTSSGPHLRSVAVVRGG